MMAVQILFAIPIFLSTHRATIQTKVSRNTAHCPKSYPVQYFDYIYVGARCDFKATAGLFAAEIAYVGRQVIVTYRESLEHMAYEKVKNCLVS